MQKNIPCLRAGSEFSQPREARESRVVPISTMLVVEEPCLPAADREENSDEENTRLNKEEEDAETERRHKEYWGDLADEVPCL